MTVAKTIPKPKETAIGIRKRAWREVSKIMGVRPPNVVRVVNIIGRNRWMAFGRLSKDPVQPDRAVPVGAIFINMLLICPAY